MINNCLNINSSFILTLIGFGDSFRGFLPVLRSSGGSAGADPGLGADGVHGPAGGPGSSTRRQEHVRGLAGGRRHRTALTALRPDR